jgi:hypothetical protein
MACVFTQVTVSLAPLWSALEGVDEAWRTQMQKLIATYRDSQRHARTSQTKDQTGGMWAAAGEGDWGHKADVRLPHMLSIKIIKTESVLGFSTLFFISQLFILELEVCSLDVHSMFTQCVAPSSSHRSSSSWS